jgi:hypothetical protein
MNIQNLWTRMKQNKFKGAINVTIKLQINLRDQKV